MLVCSDGFRQNKFNRNICSTWLCRAHADANESSMHKTVLPDSCKSRFFQCLTMYQVPLLAQLKRSHEHKTLLSFSGMKASVDRIYTLYQDRNLFIVGCHSELLQKKHTFHRGDGILLRLFVTMLQTTEASEGQSY